MRAPFGTQLYGALGIVCATNPEDIRNLLPTARAFSSQYGFSFPEPSSEEPGEFVAEFQHKTVPDFTVGMRSPLSRRLADLQLSCPLRTLFERERIAVGNLPSAVERGLLDLDVADSALASFEAELNGFVNPSCPRNAYFSPDSIAARGIIYCLGVYAAYNYGLSLGRSAAILTAGFVLLEALTYVKGRRGVEQQISELAKQRANLPSIERELMHVKANRQRLKEFRRYLQDVN